MSESTEGEVAPELDGSDESAMALLAAKREQAQMQQEPEEEEEEEQKEAEQAEEGEEGEEPETPEEDDDPEIDLGDFKVKKSELKAGYMKDADYRRKTAEAAEVKRQAQAQQERVQQERSHYANQLDVLISGLQSQLVGDQAALAQLANDDPAAWVRENAAFQQRYANLQEAIQKRQGIANLQSQEQEQALEQWREGERQALNEKLPEWRDNKVKEAESRAIGEMLMQTGYTPEEIGQLFDHRALLVARDAAKWRAHVAAKASAKDKQAQPTPAKPVKPGVPRGDNPNQQSAVREAAARLRKTGSTDDAMALLAARRMKQ